MYPRCLNLKLTADFLNKTKKNAPHFYQLVLFKVKDQGQANTQFIQNLYTPFLFALLCGLGVNNFPE